MKYPSYIFLVLTSLISCKEAKKVNTEINIQNITIAKQENTTYNWHYFKAFTLDKSPRELTNNKFINLKFKITRDSIFIKNIGKEAIYTGNINTKKYFNDIYDYQFLKNFLIDKFSINAKDSVISLRNKNTHKKTSILKPYFDDAFIIGNSLLLMSEENIIVFIDSTTQKKEKTPHYKFPITKESLVASKMKITKNIKGFEHYNCGGRLGLGYYPIGNNKWVIINSCYDFEYTELLTIDNNRNIISKLLIEEESWDIEKKELEGIDNRTVVDFVIEKDYIIKVTTKRFLNEKIKSTTAKTYKITNQGKIEEVK